MTPPPEVRGYRQKPLWIPIVGILFILTPFGNFLLTLASLRIPHWYSPQVWAYWIRYITPGTWGLMAFIFLSGFSLLFFVRTWALVLTLFTLGTVVVYNLLMIKAFSLMGTFAVSTMILTTAITIYFLYFSRFRRPYTNPKIRWWETSPRYRVDIPVKIDGVAKHGRLVDVSITGALIEWDEPRLVPAREKVKHINLPPDLHLPCVAARSTEKGYGINFDHLDKAQKKAFQTWLKQLRKDPSKILP
ncbi:MAG: PilZ domain-containing protein [Bdellovibrionales bacterium]|nr:PilZ domain-containing protein [Bdellovibrionales bacterium]